METWEKMKRNNKKEQKLFYGLIKDLILMWKLQCREVIPLGYWLERRTSCNLMKAYEWKIPENAERSSETLDRLNRNHEN